MHCGCTVVPLSKQGVDLEMEYQNLREEKGQSTEGDTPGVTWHKGLLQKTRNSQPCVPEQEQREASR